MRDTLKVGVFQFNIIWEDVLANRHRIENLLSELKTIPDLIILPEMFTTGFSIIPSGLEKEQLSSHFDWQSKLSVKYRIAIMGSVVFSEQNYFKNRLVFTKSDGSSDYYDKRHLFISERKEGYYKSGHTRKVFDLEGVKIMPQICYDLRFPVWSRNDNDIDYQILVYVANWPKVREKAWKTLLPARAIENQAYVIGVNRVGVDGNNIAYNGGSSIIDSNGESILLLGEKEEYAEVNLSISKLKTLRDEFPVYKDSDKFRIN